MVAVPDADTWLSRSGSSPPPGEHAVASAIAAGLADLAQSIDARSDNPYPISDALEKIAYALSDTSPQAALHRVADAIEKLAKPTPPVGLYIIVHEQASIPSREHITGQILGVDPDGSLWIAQPYDEVWHGSIDLDTEAADFFLTYAAYRLALDDIHEEAKDRKANERATKKATP